MLLLGSHTYQATSTFRSSLSIINIQEPKVSRIHAKPDIPRTHAPWHNLRECRNGNIKQKKNCTNKGTSHSSHSIVSIKLKLKLRFLLLFSGCCFGARWEKNAKNYGKTLLAARQMKTEWGSPRASFFFFSSFESKRSGTTHTRKRTLSEWENHWQIQLTNALSLSSHSYSVTGGWFSSSPDQKESIA